MSVIDLPVFAALKQKMLWHQTRQTLLAENVANAASPGFTGRDLADFDFDAQLRGAQAGGLSPMVTNARHLAGSGEASNGRNSHTVNGFEIAESGGGVTLEDEMMKVTANQLDYQAATTLYARSLKLIRTALGRAG